MAEEAQLSGIAGRYAQAVFELAQEYDSVDTVGRDFAVLKAMLAASRDLVRLVGAPVFGREEQARGMHALMDKVGAGPLTMRFVLLLCAKRRLYLLPEAIRGYEALVARAKGEIDADVASARPLNDSQAAELKRVLKAKLDREPMLRMRVDPTLLGGLVVKVGSRMIDSSLRSKLNALRIAMRGAS